MASQINIKKLALLQSQVNESQDKALKVQLGGPKDSFIKVYNGLFKQAEKVLNNSEYITDFYETVPKTIQSTFDIDALFSALSGFINGIIKAETIEGQMKLNAQKYAEEKLKQERKMGF